ncbi:MAG: hypothetical protein K6T78_01130 [Alicyclobacillus sp.]|nr:hypothetical protein [Alicyclobacillus sp.]
MNKSFVAAVVVGMLFGASATLAYQGKAYDRLYMENQRLVAQNSELELRNQQLTNRLERPNKEPVVESIRVDANAPDGLSEVETIQFVRNELAFLVGKPLSTLQLHPELPSRIIDGRTITVDQQQFTLHVTTVVVVSTLYIAVTASPGK